MVNNKFINNQLKILYYKAPELISKEHYNGFAADCWALGIVLYVMLVGKFPFKGKNFFVFIKYNRS